jgi:AraC family transcriptional regulator of adaptative response / methylphosphotriester-DNA alkyltransferase methyltransferase
MVLPQQQLARKDEITAEFLKMVDEHMNGLVNQNVLQRMSTKDFAGKLFIAPRHLTNTIKLTTGKSPCDIMEERIMTEAQKMLLETNLSVADIGYRFSYKDPTNFTKFFKGMAGITPLQYRKKSQNAA